MVSLNMHALHTRATKWVARGTAVVILAVGTVGYSTQHKTVTVDDHGSVYEVSTFGATVADVLEARGVKVASGDVVAPGLSENIHNGDKIAVQSPSETGLDLIDRTDVASRSLGAGRKDLATVSVTVDGATQSISTSATDVRGALQDAGVVLGEGDVVSADLSTALTTGQTITVARASTTTVTVKETVKYKVTKKNDSSILKGTKVVKTKGANGKSVTTYSVTKVGGKEVSRTPIASSVLSAAQDQVVLVGTGTAVSNGSGDSSNSSGGAPSAPSVQPGTARALGKELAAARGWGDDQFGCLEALWTRESGWSTTAGNKSSGAYGIPQALPGSKMASAGPNWRTDASTQIKWGLGYISGRYGTPCGAWAHFKSHNWY